MNKNDFEIVIGLEVHVQLNTASKAFCSCSTNFGSTSNSQTCPICLGLPGTLPVLNKAAFELAIKVALALDCKLQETTRFDRKNYFYPDLPKNFQISQYDLPLGYDGSIKINDTPIRVKRVHLEEDAGKLIHEENSSLVDYNRAGIALLEIVSEPDIHSSDQAYDYLKSLKAILMYLGVSSCDMEKGILRCDANISLKPKEAKDLGVKTELKNLNSFKAVKLSLEYETERQFNILNSGGKIIQETRLWDAKKLQSVSMRSKEEAKDYRYFPEPDLPIFRISKELEQKIKVSIIELPQARQKRFMENLGLSAYDASVLTDSKNLADYFEECLKFGQDGKKISNWLMGAFQEELNKRSIEPKESKVKPKELVDLIAMVEKNILNNLSAKQVLTFMFDTGAAPEIIVKEKNLAQISDSKELEQIIETVIKENQNSINDYSQGKTNALMFLVGQVMRLSKGKANPKVVAELLENKINGGKT